MSRTDALKTEGTSAVRQYLDGLRDGDYRRSYGLLCSDLRGAITLGAFTSEKERQPHVTGYQLYPAQLAGAGVVVSADVTLRGAPTDYRTFELVEDAEAGVLRICRGE